MLPASEWLKQAQALREGESRRIEHVCGDGTPLIIAHEVGYWRAWCHRCHEGGRADKPGESFHEKMERRRREAQAASEMERSVHLPQPMNFDVPTWPLSARIWLYKAGLTNPRIAELGAYWHERSGRVVLPIFDGDVPVYWQARDCEWKRGAERPKYLNPRVDKQHLVAKYGQGKLLVLTEDVLSAFRVGRHTEAWSLLGTDLTTAVAAQIKKPVAIWLDPDAAGVSAGRTILKELRAQGIEAQRVTSRADPKLLSDEEIIQCLSSLS
ncbi:putative DNA primase [Ralstonia phage BHDT_So9]|uniref:DNA primase n=1 Tax=Ralstonia phage BHDT_So9 TaxID=2972464 RepID=A0A9E7QYD8_9CAUD|nr:putative DNA primase [Ralstonia phage BHDT_So9]UWI83536.1 putative DNA primase [Ralstonia phage DLDT_So2]UZT26924.1 putative DNA primase [Ralstonia phage BHDTSo81]WEM03452.1 primase/helicase protein [Ralstonia phage BHDT8]